MSSSPEERERRLNNLGSSFGRDLDVEIRRERFNLREKLTQDFERLKHALVVMISQKHSTTGLWLTWLIEY
jgi:hypothetical protein